MTTERLNKVVSKEYEKLITKEEIVKQFILQMNARGYVMLVLALPDSDVLPLEAKDGYAGVWGNYPDTLTQVSVLKQITRKLENSIDAKELVHDERCVQ